MFKKNKSKLLCMLMPAFLNVYPVNVNASEIQSSVPATAETTKELSEEAQFVKGLDLDKLEDLISGMKYVPFSEYSKVKPAKGQVDTSDIEDLIRLIDIYHSDECESSIQDQGKFYQRIMDASEKLRYKNHANWNIPGFIRWSTNLVRYWTTYNLEIVCESSGIGADIDSDGLGDMVESESFLELQDRRRQQARQDPKKFINEVKENKKKYNSTPLDVLLEETEGNEGKLMLVCRHQALLNQRIFEISKHLNPASKNTFCLRVRNSNHMWNLFATVNEQGIFYTSVDATYSDNGSSKFSLKADLDFTGSDHETFFWDKNYAHMMAGVVLRRENQLTEAQRILIEALNNNLIIYKSELPLAIGDMYVDLGAEKLAAAFYSASRSVYGKYQRAYSQHKLGMFEESNNSLQSILELYTSQQSDKWRENDFFDESLPLAGLNYYHLGNYDKSLEMFKLSLQINPRYRDISLDGVYSCYLAKGDDEKAAEYLARLRKEYPEFKSEDTLSSLAEEFWY